ncbi:MAG TPA: toll/interleukin-1 receptor domain-containing protein, partial [Ktedonobacterales bacterium]
VRPTHHWYNNLIDDGYNLVVSRLLGVPGTYSGLLTFLVDATFFNFSPDVFLSYRRADSAVMCGRIYQALSRWSRLGQRVFRDTNAISAGVDFYSTLLGAIASSEVVVAIIGPRWLSLVGPTGARRLNDPEDMVRREVETALDSEKTIIPVLLDDTPMPTVAQLPERLAPLASLTPLRMRSGPGFARDSARLAAEVRRCLGIESHPALAALSALAAVAAGGALSLWQTRSDGIAYLFQQHPAWCYQTPVALCFGNRPDPRVITALGWLLTVGLGGLAVALLAAFWLMTRRRQFVWLFVLGVYTLLLGVFAAVVAAIFAGRLPATVPLGVFNGASYSSLTIYAFVAVLLEVAIVGALGLAWYFWRSRGRPRDLPAAV